MTGCTREAFDEAILLTLWYQKRLQGQLPSLSQRLCISAKPVMQ